MQKIPDVAIVGGGVVGLTTAYYLAREGASVQVFDRSAPGTEASWAGAGIIPPGDSTRAVTAYDRLRAISSEAFPALSNELFNRTGIDNGYRVCGGVEVLDGNAADVTQMWSAEGIAFERVHSESDLRLPTGDAFLLPGMAQVRNPWHMRALIEACKSWGVQIIASSAICQVLAEKNRFVAVVDESNLRHRAERFLIASGAWTDRLLAPLGATTHVHPVRGQIVLFHPHTPLLKAIVIVGKRYLVPRDDGRILVGSTEEPEAGFEKQTTESGVTGLVEFAINLLPTLRDARIEKTWAGLRPGSHDELPTMGRLPNFDNAFVAAGHFRSGIQLSPGTGMVMSELLTDREPSIPLDDFRVGRPPATARMHAFRS